VFDYRTAKIWREAKSWAVMCWCWYWWSWHTTMQ